MSAGSSAEALHPIEQTILKALSSSDNDVLIDSLSTSTGLSIDQIRRGIEWLKFKDFVSIKESLTEKIYLASEGVAAVAKGLPERRLLNAAKEGKNTIEEILASGSIRNEEVNAAIAGARRNQWIQLIEGKIVPAQNQNYEKQSPEEAFLADLKDGTEITKLGQEQKKTLEQLKRRPNYVEIKQEKESRVLLTDAGKKLISILEEKEKQEVDQQQQQRRFTTIRRQQLTSELITSGKWRETKFSPIDVEAQAPTIFPGRRHPLVDIIEEVKEIFVGLGFTEIDGPLLQSGFWNFDALFTPQDHSAREMQDTFYVSGQKQPVPATKDQIQKVSDIHKKGWSKNWDLEEARRIVLRTHTTPVTLRHLASIKPAVGRFFSIGRVFRNEKVSYKHLVEFHQVEGVATSQGISLRDLMGLQKEFYAKMGIKKVKFWPTFFPYTEPSLQSMIYNEKMEKWIELFGMGIFRPEVTEPLGMKNPVLAWGGGLERIAMLRFGLDDVRELYSNKLAWLRGVPRCQL